MTNLYLCCYEDRWMWKTKRKYLITVLKFGNIFRFTDDLTAINDVGKLQKALHEIYPPKLELKMEKVSPFGVYDKLDSFPFSIVVKQLTHLLKYFTTHLDLKFLELTEPPLILISFNFHVRYLFQG